MPVCFLRPTHRLNIHADTELLSHHTVLLLRDAPNTTIIKELRNRRTRTKHTEI